MSGLESLLRTTKDEDTKAVVGVLSRVVEYVSQTCAIDSLLEVVQNLEAAQVGLTDKNIPEYPCNVFTLRRNGAAVVPTTKRNLVLRIYTCCAVLRVCSRRRLSS